MKSHFRKNRSVWKLVGLLVVCLPMNAAAANNNGDGTTDVSDLLDLLSAWGPCE